MERPKYQCGLVFSPVFSSISVQVEGRAQDADGEMRQVRSVIVQLDPADHAMVLQILRDFRFAYAQMFGEFCLQAAVKSRASAANGFGGAASAAASEVSQADAQGLASFDVVRSDLVGIRKQEHSRPGGS